MKGGTPRRSRTPRIPMALVIVCLVLLIHASSVYASGGGMKLDGKFGDWDDKPRLEDGGSDAGREDGIYAAGWFLSLEDGRLYIYCEGRGTAGKKDKRQRDFKLELSSGKSGRTVNAVLEFPNRVSVSLLDEEGRYLWGASGKWGKSNALASEIEFYVPLEFVVQTPGEESSISMVFYSGEDRLPDNGEITISSISAFPSLWYIPLIALWIALLIILYNLKLRFFSFVTGSIGLFILLMHFGSGFERDMAYAVTWAVGLLTKSSRMILSLPRYSTITVFYKAQAMSYYVDYECSGIIETLVYVCLLVFYPLYRPAGKLMLLAAGSAYIFAANVVRVVIICLSVRLFGPDAYFFSHTLIARIVFFVLMIFLYYRVFTRPHIIRQKAGGEV